MFSAPLVPPRPGPRPPLAVLVLPRRGSWSRPPVLLRLSRAFSLSGPHPVTFAWPCWICSAIGTPHPTPTHVFNIILCIFLSPNAYFWDNLGEHFFYLDLYHYNLPKLEIYHYNSPIWKFTITTSSFTDPCYSLRLPAIWAHCQAYLYCAYFLWSILPLCSNVKSSL
jgi:hypothetical protein